MYGRGFRWTLCPGRAFRGIPYRHAIVHFVWFGPFGV